MSKLLNSLKKRLLLFLLAGLAVFIVSMYGAGGAHEKYLIARYLETSFSLAGPTEVSYGDFAAIVESGQVEKALFLPRSFILQSGYKGFLKTRDGLVVGADLSQRGLRSFPDELIITAGPYFPDRTSFLCCFPIVLSS